MFRLFLYKHEYIGIDSKVFSTYIKFNIIIINCPHLQMMISLIVDTYTIML